ncbi:hypothetical protein ACVWZ6_005165 [Bradyrhizobium sp. GM6.1]
MIRRRWRQRYFASDVDEFRNAIRGLDFEFTPFVRRISAEQSILSLPGCDVNLTRAFPRVVDAQLVENCTAIGFTMDDLDVTVRFNGARRIRPVIVIGSGGAAYTIIEEVQRQIASVVFRPEVTDRGWPQATLCFNIFETTAGFAVWSGKSWKPRRSPSPRPTCR